MRLAMDTTSSGNGQATYHCPNLNFNHLQRRVPIFNLQDINQDMVMGRGKEAALLNNKIINYFPYQLNLLGKLVDT
jgi:hypothetical protein